MVVWAVRMKKVRTIVIILVLGAALFWGIAALFGLWSGYRASKQVPQLLTAQERESYITSLGWKLAEEYSQVQQQQPDADEITVPRQFNAVYNDYNNLQKEQGFDLSAWKGETVTRYVYLLDEGNGKTAKKSGLPPPVFLTLLITREGALIGGHISSGVQGTEMLPFIPAEETKQEK